MNRRKPFRQRTRPGHERWLVSYADFITLLFAFFVVLYASSQADQKKAARVASAIQQAFQTFGIGQSPAPASLPPTSPTAHEIGSGASAGPAAVLRKTARIQKMSPDEVEVLTRQMQGALEQEIDRREIQLRVTPDGLVISLQELAFFDSGSATLRPASQSSFARIAALLKERRCEVRIEGHTDTIPIHTAQFDSNWELSTARATGLVKLLVQQYDYDPASLAAGGYAEFHPIAGNQNPEGRGMNRRVDLVIVSALAPTLGGAAAGPGEPKPPQPPR